MVFVVLCPGTPEGSTGSCSGFKASQKTGPRLKVSVYGVLTRLKMVSFSFYVNINITF